MKKKFLGLGLAAGLALASSPVLAQQNKAQTIAQADQKIAGVVQGRSNGTLNLQPYGGGSAFSVQLPESTPVYQGGGVIETRALVKGVNVRVHYDQAATATPKAVAVEVLNPQEAQAAKQQPQKVPQQKQASKDTPTIEPQTTIATPSPKLPEDIRTRLAQADGEQAGTLQQASGDTISYDPYQKAAGDATLALPTDIVVFRGAEKLSRDALKPNADARVFYEIAEDGAPRAVAVQLLTPEEASKLSKAYADAPKPSSTASAALPADLPSDLREKVSSADGHQPGEVQQVTADGLTLDPFNESAGIAKLSLPSDAAFFRGNQKVERSEISAGDDVRVFYENTEEGTPRIVAVQLLSSEEAQELKSE